MQLFILIGVDSYVGGEHFYSGEGKDASWVMGGLFWVASKLDLPLVVGKRSLSSVNGGWR